MRHHSRQPRSRLHTAFTTILLLESVALLVSLPAAAVLGAALLLLTRPRIRRWFDSRFGEAHFSAESDARMSRPRLWIANLLIGVLVLGSLSAIWRGKEYWPFSNYPMYSGIERPVAAWMRIYGVTDASEVRLDATRQLAPFDDQRLVWALRRLQFGDDGEARAAGARYLLDLYETRRSQGEHDGPPIRALRVYRWLWELESGAANRDRPDKSELVLEISAGSGEDGS